MPWLPLDFPPGVYRNGTDLETAGRWRDASLVRWRSGALRPVGGWRLRSETAISGVPRGCLAWQDNSGGRRLAVGTHDGLFVVSSTGTISDITPSDLVAGRVRAQLQVGYGTGPYGVGPYGSPRPDPGTYSEATVWSMAPYGQLLMACSPQDGRILEWGLDTNVEAAAVTNAPTGNLAVAVTSERFVVALGAGGNPRNVAWSDREDYDAWAPTATNEAGDFELDTNGQIMRAIQSRGELVIITDNDAHTMSYIGPPFVHSFERVGVSCGIVSRGAAASVAGGVYWMGQRGFFAYAGGAVEELPCDVVDYVFSDINRAQQSQVYAVKNAAFAEIWWFYPDSDSNECNRYVAYNHEEGHWSIGAIERTCGIDRGTFRQPIWFGPDGKIYDHEVGWRHGDQTPFVESGPVSMGERLATFTALVPDEGAQGQVRALFKGRFWPNGEESEYGPYDAGEPTDVLFTARQVRARFEGVVNDDWRIGTMRLEARLRGRH